ncbi:RNA polymerase sigma-70 factor, ECF subfamily [Chitinophaga sp. CF118]|uniref:RNA polymerase sigma factor n=1 Tax=Chitinophaga sp. CF118 TaxID=1884367 RepID=UPI0008EDD114|nr:sigma-70 family RNA polymerase sigma factor [Chitinophaga sp. CF118]SFF08418.1 RNA polymerase sigma-70 factor, ECF subfamily [Chitinophaga sp. CF118]
MMNSKDAFDDSEIVRRLNQRDNAAFTLVYEQYSPLLTVHAIKMTNNNAFVKDLVQDTFSSLLEKMGNLNPEISVGGYLYITLRRKIMNMDKRDELRANYIDSLQDYLDGKNYEADGQLLYKEFRELIDKEIARLPRAMRKAFEMSRKEYLSHQEIAEATGTSEETVKRQISYSIKTLRARLIRHFYLLIMLLLLIVNKIIHKI